MKKSNLVVAAVLVAVSGAAVVATLGIPTKEASAARTRGKSRRWSTWRRPSE